MDLTIHIPDELVAHLGGEAIHHELERRALEGFALEELRAGRITEIQLRKMLGLGHYGVRCRATPRGRNQKA